MAGHAYSTVVPFPLTRADVAENLPSEVHEAISCGTPFTVEEGWKRMGRPPREDHEFVATVLSVFAGRLSRKQRNGFARDLEALARS